MRSGLGVMLLISLIGAAIVAPRRLSFLYAALATIALLLEQSYWVLAHDAPTASFVQPGLLAIGYFVAAGVTSWLAARVAANERLARQRGRELATQTRVNQLVIEDMNDGVLVLDRGGRWCSTTRRRSSFWARRACSAWASPAWSPGFSGSAEIEVAGRSIRLRPLERGAAEFSVLLVEDTTRAREQAQQLKLAALGRLTANIAHEIRNPLAAISHAAELLREEKRAEDRARLTRIIHDNAGRLERLVSDVLQLNKRDRVSAAPLRLELLARRLHRRVRRQRARAARAPGARGAARVVDRIRPRAPAPGDVEPAAQRAALCAPRARQHPRAARAPRRSRRALGDRQRPGRAGGDPGAALRALLHHRGEGHRPRPVPRARAVRREPRRARVRQTAQRVRISASVADRSCRNEPPPERRTAASCGPGPGGRRRARYPRAARAHAGEDGPWRRRGRIDRRGEGAAEARALRPVPHRHAARRRRGPRAGAAHQHAGRSTCRWR